MKELGANTVRVLLFWWQVAPNSSSRTAPRGFKASNPAAYPAHNWAQWDAIVQAAKAEGIRVDLDITGAPPDWADGKGAPRHFTSSRFGWRPNAADYGQFVRAVATRYSGHYTPPGASAPLPKVSLYSLWNEPNFGQNLGPQYVGATNKSAGLPVAPMYYRNLLRSGWSALRQDAKGATILIGELAGTGKGPLHEDPRPAVRPARPGVDQQPGPVHPTAVLRRQPQLGGGEVGRLPDGQGARLVRQGQPGAVRRERVLDASLRLALDADREGQLDPQGRHRVPGDRAAEHRARAGHIGLAPPPHLQRSGRPSSAT